MRSHSPAQRGSALPVVLLLLLLVTVLGLAAMRGSLMQEKMTSNAVARSYSFQAAEAVLREAESFAQAKPAMPAAGCNGGLCAQPLDGAQSAWEAAGFWDDGGAGYRIATTEFKTGDPDDPVVIRPKYVVEDFGLGSINSNCSTDLDVSAAPCSTKVQRYRVTVYSRAPNGAEVILQSAYEVP